MEDAPAQSRQALEEVQNRLYQASRRPPDTVRLLEHHSGDFLLAPGWPGPGAGPLHLDVGCGLGRFLLAEALKHPGNSYLGVEPDGQCLRRVLSKLESRRSRGEAPANVRLFHGSVFHLLPLLPARSVSVAYVNYPDPWFKRRHHKRRVLSALFFEELAPRLATPAQVFIQTDVPDFAADIRDLLGGLAGFRASSPAEPLFDGLSVTLYQEKAAKNNHERHCFHLAYPA